MLKIMRSNKLKRFIAVLFILLSVFSMCFSVAAKAEAVTLGIGTVVVIGTMLAACGLKFANSADTARAVDYVYKNLTFEMKSIVSGLVSLCEGYQKARLQIPFSVFETFSNLFFSLFATTSSSATVDLSNSVDLTVKLPASSSSSGSVVFASSGVDLSLRCTPEAGIEYPSIAPLVYSWGTVNTMLKSEVFTAANGVKTYYPVYIVDVSFSDGYGFEYVSYAVKNRDNYCDLLSYSSDKAACSLDLYYSLPFISGERFFPSCIGKSNYDAGGNIGGFKPCYVSGVASPSDIMAAFPYVGISTPTSGGFVSAAAASLPSTLSLWAWAYGHYTASLAQNEDLLNYGVSRNPALSTNPDCMFPQTVDGSKDVYMDIPALKDTSLDDLITKNPADVATPADTKVENPTLVEGADTNVGEGDVTVPSDASWLDKILAWLKALLDGILSIPGAISKGIAGVLDGIKAIPAAFAKWFESIIEGIKAIGLSFTDWLSKLIEGFKSLLLSLFEPTISLDEAFAALKAKALAKFPTDGLIDSISAFRDYLSGLGDTPPSFTFVYMGNTCTIAPFDWLSGYRRYWIAFASFFMWFGFIRRTIKRMPQLLGGIT